MTTPETSNTESNIGCMPETLLQIKEQRLRQAENQADIYLGALLELQAEVRQITETRDARIEELERQLADVEPPT